MGLGRRAVAVARRGRRVAPRVGAARHARGAGGAGRGARRWRGRGDALRARAAARCAVRGGAAPRRDDGGDRDACRGMRARVADGGGRGRRVARRARCSSLLPARRHRARGRGRRAVAWQARRRSALGLALGHEPLVGACALAGCRGARGRRGEARAGRSSTRGRRDARALVACLVAGLAPLVVAVARSARRGAAAGRRAARWVGRAKRGVARGVAGARSLHARARHGARASLAVAGRSWRRWLPRARALAAGLVVLAAARARVGMGRGAARPDAVRRAGARGDRARPARSPASRCRRVVRAIAEARLPAGARERGDGARARAGGPRRLGRRGARRGRSRARPGRAAAVGRRRVGRRCRRAPWCSSPTRASGARRGGAGGGLAPRRHRRRRRRTRTARAAERVLASDAALVPLWRDLELAGRRPRRRCRRSHGAPARHGVRAALGTRPRQAPRARSRLLDRFEPEPRGASDRREALDAFAPKRERLGGQRGTTRSSRQAAAYLLRARALDIAASGDRDLVGRAVEDLHGFAPDDPVGTAMVARVVMGHGSTKLDDMRP